MAVIAAARLVSVAMRLQLVVGALLALSAQSLTSDSANTSDVMRSTAPAAAAVPDGSDSSRCAPLNTLTFDCPSVCGAAQQPCIRYASLSECESRLGGAGETPALSACASYASSSSLANASACGVECFRAPDRALATTFAFFIPFSLASLGTSAPANATNGVLSKNEDALQRIAVLDLPATTDVYIAGGTSASASVKGRVVETTLANWLLTSKTQLERVTIANVNVTLLPEDMFPRTLSALTLANLYLTTLPTDLPTMTQLQRLNVTQNNLRSFPSKFGLASLTTLDVSSNNLNKFDAVSPDLEYLDLSNNVFESVPASIFQMPKLRYLNLRANAFTDVVLSPAQFAFLQNVSTLVIDSFGPLACASAAQQTLESATVCVDDRISTAAVAHTRSSSSDATLVAVVIASVAAMALVVIGSVVWLRQRGQDTAAAEKLADFSASQGTASAKGSTITQSPYVEAAQTPSNAPHATTASSLDSARQSLWDDYDLASLQVQADDIKDVRRIGAGAFAVVWLVCYRKTQLAASKRLKRDEQTWQRTQSFVAEIKLVARLDHERIVRLIGVAWTIESDLQALFEYMASGDVRTYLADSAEDFCGVWTAEKLAIVRHVAEALVYLHSFMPPLVHRDLKSRNILLSDDMSAKVSDFGVSRFQSEHETMTAGVGTGKWLAPEVLAGNGDYNQASDIYALGVVLSEMDTHELPYAGLRGPMDNALSEVAVLQMVAAGTLRPSLTRDCPTQIRALADACLAFDPTKRPTAYQVAYMLRSIEASGEY